MPLHIEPDSGIPIYLQLVDGLVELIATGEIVEGEEAPASRAMAAEERVNYHTVNRAFGILEEQGFFVRQRGGAYRIADGARARAASRLLTEDLERLCRRAKALGLNRQTLVEALDAVFNRASASQAKESP